MRIRRIGGTGLTAMIVLFIGPVTADDGMKPPIAKIEPMELEKHGDVRIDNYFWLKEREDTEVVAYLKEENAYADAVMAHTKQLQEELFEEIKGRIKQTDMSVPYKLDDYYYYSRYADGKEYPVYCRKKDSLEGEEHVMLDLNEMAEGHDYIAVWGREVSADQTILAFAVDYVGRRVNTIRFKDLATGAILPDEIEDVTYNFRWANDNKTIFYTKQDTETLRWNQVYKHVLGSPVSEDVLIFEEKDEEFGCSVAKTKSKKYLFISSYQTLSNEYRYLEADNPDGDFKVFLAREREHEYDVDHFGDHFYIRTNLDAKNFRLMRTPVDNTAKKNWEEVIAHRDDVLLRGFEVFRDHLVVSERMNGLRQMRVIRWSDGEEHYLDFGEPAYLAWFSQNPDINTAVLRFGYESMTTPESFYDYDMDKRTKKLLKQTEILGGFDSANYLTERVEAVARDGVNVPVSMVYRKGFSRDGSHPLLLYAYGSYGYSMDAYFSPARLSLLDRGFVYAVAHVRGGQEMGRWWYEDGKLLKKKNTFTDFIDCAEYLVAEKYADPDRVFCQGGSAGGLLVGAVVNMRPDLFNGAIADVPFVDVVTTMLDESIPLTTGEYDEWGNPNDRTYYDYMLSYSPYDNVEAKAYPNMLVTTGLHDSQVQYWEPAKWVAKLRALKTDDNLLLLHTNMDAGHGGKSGRFRRYRETALEYAFLMNLAGISNSP